MSLRNTLSTFDVHGCLKYLKESAKIGTHTIQKNFEDEKAIFKFPKLVRYPWIIVPLKGISHLFFP